MNSDMSSLLCIAALLAMTATDPATRPAVRIALVGDSTVTGSAGWGTGFASCWGGGVEVLNFARGGRSSKSYRDEGHWDQHARPSGADYVLIQFGHNDQPGKGPERETDPATTFRDNLRRYVAEARAAGMKPVLVTSLVRRKFDTDGRIRSDLAAYADATTVVAAETGTPLIDLHALSIDACNKLGLAGCEAISAAPKQPGTIDTTHLNARGSELFGRIVADELCRVVPQLAVYRIATEQK